MTSTTVKPDIHSCEYDEAQDMLFVLFAPIQGHDYYETTAADPDLLLRYTDKGARLIGLSLHNPLPRLNGAPATAAAIRQLAEELVARYAARYARAGTSRPQEG